MSILSTNKKLINIGKDYSAGSGIDITNDVISVIGNTVPYSAGENIDIQDFVISSKDWSNDITDASANAFNETTAWVHDNYTNSADVSFLSAEVDKKLDSSAWKAVSGSLATEDYVILSDNLTYARATAFATSQGYAKESACNSAFDYLNENKLDSSAFDLPNSGHWNEATNVVETNSGSWSTVSDKLDTTAFTAWQYGDYATDLQTVEGQIDNKLDKSVFSDVSGSFLTAISIPESATWNDVSTTVKTNSSNWDNISNKLDTTAFSDVSGTFLTAVDLSPYSTTAEVESISSMLSGAIDYVSANAGGGGGGGSDFDPTYMSAQIDNKLNKSEVGFRKVNGVDYVSGISGKTISARYASTAQNANTANYANTASYDNNGNSLTTTYYNAQEANNKVSDLFNFVQSNSANWEGGSSPAGEGVLFHRSRYYSFDPNYGSQSDDSRVSGATELYFDAYVDSQQGTPSDVVITRYGSEIGRAYWTQVSSDGSYNYYTASYNNVDGGEVQLQNNGYDYECYVSANGAKTYAFKQGKYNCSTDKTVKFNINGYNFHGQIEGLFHGRAALITSFAGGLTDFTAKGFEEYRTNISYEDSNSNNYYYDLSAEFGAGGSTVASGDVFPPTNNLDPYTTYYLGWNANNGGLQWFYQGGNGN